MENNIKGKVVVITVASSGIGEASAKLLAKKGAKVVLGARRTHKLKTIIVAGDCHMTEGADKVIDYTNEYVKTRLNPPSNYD